MQSKKFQDLRWQTKERKSYNVSCLLRKTSYIPANRVIGYCYQTALEQMFFYTAVISQQN